MQDLFAVRVVERGGERAQDRKRLSDRHGRAAAAAQNLRQVFAFCKIHHQIVFAEIRVLLQLAQAGNGGMVQFRDNGVVLADALHLRLVAGKLRRKALEGHFNAADGIEALVNHPHAAGAKF